MNKKNKIIGVFIALLIGLIWGGVLFLEYQIKSNNEKQYGVFKLEKDLCIHLPNNCNISSLVDNGYSLYCKSGTVGRIMIDKTMKDNYFKENKEDVIYLRLKGKRSYFIEIKLNEGKDKNLAEKVDC